MPAAEKNVRIFIKKVKNKSFVKKLVKMLAPM